MAKLGYVDKIQDPTSSSDYYEIVDTHARELVHKVEKTIVDTLPAKPTTKDAWLEMEPYLYYVPIADKENEYKIWTLFFIGDPSVASDYTNQNNYVWEEVQNTDVDLSNVSMTGHTHEVIPEVSVDDHDYTPQGTVESTFTGREGTTNSYTHSHTFTPHGSVSGSITGTRKDTESATTGITLNKDSKKLSTKKLKLESASVSLTPSTSTVAKNTFASNSGSYDADKSIFNNISVSNGVLSFVTKKLDTSDVVSGMTGSTSATKVTFGGNTTTEEDVATGAVEAGSQLVGNDAGLTDNGHTHKFTPNGSFSANISGTYESTSNDTHSHAVTPNGDINSSFKGVRANLKHKVDSKKVRTSPDQEDPSGYVFDWYGIRYPENAASRFKERIGNLDMHRMLPIQTKMRRCLLKDDGTVYNYLDPENSLYYAQGSKDANGNDISGRIAEIAGTAYSTYGDNTSTAFAVQVMVEIPEHWRKVYRVNESGTDYVYAKISPYPQEGWHHVEKNYVGAFEASIVDGKLASTSDIKDLVYSHDANGKIVVGCNLSTSRMPKTYYEEGEGKYLTVDNYRYYARKRNNNLSAEWNGQTIQQWNDIAWLFFIEYATTNSQEQFKSERDANGFMQGGLGMGFSEFYNWGSYNNYYPVVPCGVTACLGNHSGEILITVAGANYKVNSYRGVEMPFGHLWKLVDGIKYYDNTIYRAVNPSDFSNAESTTGYVEVGSKGTSGGYVTTVKIQKDSGYDERFDGDLTPTGVGGDTASYYCDHYWMASGWRCCLLGGVSNDGGAVGFVCLKSSFELSSADQYSGSRLTFLPSSEDFE